MSKFEIRITKVNNEAVSLEAMSLEGLHQFLEAMRALKSLAQAVTAEPLQFAISEGSAVGSVAAANNQTDIVSRQINTAIDKAVKGKSDNKEVTDNLRTLQKQIKSSEINLEFTYYSQNQPVLIHETLRNARQISQRKKRVIERPKIELVEGKLIEIGGKTCNYHLDFVKGTTDEEITVSSTEEEAVEIKDFLYNRVSSLVISVPKTQSNQKRNYTHKFLFNQSNLDLLDHFSLFIESYNKEKDLVTQLTWIYDFLDEIEAEKDRLRIISIFLTIFNDKRFHSSELKTILVISKNLKSRQNISDKRVLLLNTYNTKRKQKK